MTARARNLHRERAARVGRSCAWALLRFYPAVLPDRPATAAWLTRVYDRPALARVRELDARAP